MFHIPDAKRVRRDELYDSDPDASGSGSEADDAEERARLQERLASLLGLDLATAEEPADPPPMADAADADGQQGQEEEEEFEFRLFSTGLSKGAAAPTRVVLADEDAPRGEGAFTVPARPVGYYLAGAATPAQLAEYRCAAVAGEDVVLGARKRAWGLERPWRVVRISSASSGGRALGAAGDASKEALGTTGAEARVVGEKRKRPGKKRRIKMRIKTKADRDKREAEEKVKLSKEEHLREKKKRLNREKKLKRRAKEREKKLALGQPVSEAADSGSDDEAE